MRNQRFSDKNDSKPTKNHTTYTSPKRGHPTASPITENVSEDDFTDADSGGLGVLARKEKPPPPQQSPHLKGSPPGLSRRGIEAQLQEKGWGRAHLLQG